MTRRPLPPRSVRLSGLRRASAVLVAAGVLLATPAPAGAWDPSTTHQAMLEQALLRSALHRRWMDASELQRGVFSSLRVDPGLLDEEERRLLRVAMRRGHADLGATALGGPGACPGADAPAETQQYCVDGDHWELSALGWMRLGILAETVPTERLEHHFLDADDRQAARWIDPTAAGSTTRRRSRRSNGSPTAGVVAASGFAGGGPSAAAWLADPDDPLAPPRMHRHLLRASLASDPDVRDHHLAMALVGTGALLHVVQDMTVPAHARGDALAFFAPLSTVPGDRGLPLQEFARVEYGRRALPASVGEPPPRPGGVPTSSTLREHILGEGEFTASHFLSEGRLPAPMALPDDLAAEAAATRLLEGSGLDAAETQGARLTPWPAPSGYLTTASGRALAAFETDEAGRIALVLDTAVYRDQAAQLVPRAIDASRSVLDLLWPEFAPPTIAGAGAIVEIEVPDGLRDVECYVLLQDGRGIRRQTQRLDLPGPGRHRLVGLPAPTDDGGRVVLVLSGARGDTPYVREQVLSPTTETRPETSPDVTN